MPYSGYYVLSEQSWNNILVRATFFVAVRLWEEQREPRGVESTFFYVATAHRRLHRQVLLRHGIVFKLSIRAEGALDDTLRTAYASSCTTHC